MKKILLTSLFFMAILHISKAQTNTASQIDSIIKTHTLSCGLGSNVIHHHSYPRKALITLLS